MLSERAAANRALLYCQEILTESPTIAVPCGLGGPSDRSSLLSELLYLIAIRPLVEAEVVHFARLKWSSSEFRDPAIRASLVRLTGGRPLDPDELGDDWWPVFSMQVFLAKWPGCFTPVLDTQSRWQHFVSSLASSESPLADQRRTRERKLATLRMPRIDGALESIVALRQSEELFAEWREALARALSSVGEPNGQAAWPEQAAAVVRAELIPFEQQLEARLTRGNVLSRLRSGSTEWGFAAVGAVAGSVAAASPTAAATGALTAATAAGVARQVTGALRDRNNRNPMLAAIHLTVLMEEYPTTAKQPLPSPPNREV